MMLTEKDSFTDLFFIHPSCSLTLARLKWFGTLFRVWNSFSLQGCDSVLFGNVLGQRQIRRSFSLTVPMWLQCPYSLQNMAYFLIYGAHECSFLANALQFPKHIFNSNCKRFWQESVLLLSVFTHCECVKSLKHWGSKIVLSLLWKTLTLWLYFCSGNAVF